ncbi:MAG: LytTR family transcriptional regulator [Chloroflexi bacterium]|nr:LytTR family transcriptional regulator [Chloroflexota bacterium]
MSGVGAGGSFELRFPVKSEPGRVLLLEKSQIFYVEAEADDSLIRTARKKRYRHSERLDQVEARLPSPPFFRIHRSYVVNLNRVFELRSRGDDEWELKMDPPVNKVLPVSRRRLRDLRKLLGI